MSRHESKRIDTTAASSSGLNSAFGNLNIEGLPYRPLPETSSQKTPEPTTPSKKGRVVLRKETAQRGGKVVIVISEFESSISSDEIETLAKDLRKHCGCGGCVKDREIEIQGNQPERIREFLINKGFRVVGLQSKM